MECDYCGITLAVIAVAFTYILYALGVINRLLYKVRKIKNESRDINWFSFDLMSKTSFLFRID